MMEIIIITNVTKLVFNLKGIVKKDKKIQNIRPCIFPKISDFIFFIIMNKTAI